MKAVSKRRVCGNCAWRKSGTCRNARSVRSDRTVRKDEQPCSKHTEIAR